MTSLVRWVPTRAPVTPNAAGACAPFGVVPVETGTEGGRGRDTPTEVIHNVLCRAPGEVVVVSGPSGAGKSTALRACARELLRRGQRVHEAGVGVVEDRALVDQLPGVGADRLGALAHAGLADATTFCRTPGELSAGERSRFELALAIARAQRGDWVVCDEFCSVLDRATAHAVSSSVRAWASRSGCRVLVATAHEDAPALLGADVVVAVDHGGRAALGGRARRVRARVRYEDGTWEDYLALERFHYRGGAPATRVLVRRAVRELGRGRERLAGVMVVSMPTLNAAWREVPWPGRYASGDKRADARRINRELRCISRVIVEPGSRGLGIAHGVVADYLRAPLTRATEAVAQMGSVCPFFERAGMTPYPLGVRADEARLLDAFDAAGVPVPGACTPGGAGDAHLHPLIRREVVRWERARKVHRAVRGMGMGERVRIAAALAGTKPVAYAWSG